MTIRKIAGLATALLMVAALMPLAIAPAFGQVSNPDAECGVNSDWNGEYWKVQYDDGSDSFGEIETSSNVDAGDITLNLDGSWSNSHDDPVIRIVLKVGGGVGSDLVYDPPENPVADLTEVEGLSHITFCFGDESTTTTTSSTTTTTEPTTTSSTTSSTTTTTEPTTTSSTTTTTEPTTTSSTTSSTTTTTEPTTTSSTTSTTTTTEPDVGGETTSTTSTTTTTEPEVEQETTSTTEATEDTLPFTGIGTDGMAMAAVLALASGAGLIFLTRRSAESEIDV